MNSLFITVALALFGALCASADDLQDHAFITSLPRELQQNALLHARAARQNVVDNGCDVNLCFGIDGSGSTNRIQFQTQLQFVDFIVNILATDEPGNFCAVQYSTINSAISPLTGDMKEFLSKLNSAEQSGGLSNGAAGLGYLGFQLRPRKEDANKIVLLGNGFDTIGADPVQVARRIRGFGYVDICAVEVGFSNAISLRRITGDRRKVFKLDEFFELGDVIIGLVNNVCGY